MRKKNSESGATKVLGYFLVAVGFLIAISFYAMGNLGIVSNVATGVMVEMGGMGEFMVNNMGSLMWLGIGILVVGLTAVAIEETKEEPE